MAGRCLKGLESLPTFFPPSPLEGLGMGGTNSIPSLSA